MKSETYHQTVSVSDAVISAADGCGELVIVAPYIKAEAIERLLALAANDVQLMCVTRWQTQDMALGASDVQCRQIVLSMGGQFLLHPTLHAKYYRFDDRILIGSANLTLSGMGWGSHPNLEILAPPSDAFDYRAFEMELLARARPVSETEYEHWAAIQSAPAEIVAATPQMSRHLNWRPVTREFANLILAYHGRAQDIASTDEARRAQSDIAALSLPRDLPTGQLRMLVTMSLLSSAFASEVLRVQHMDSVNAARELSDLYGVPLNVARHDMETVHNWLRELAPELLPSSENQ